MAQSKDKPVVAQNAPGSVAKGDHTAADLEGSYRDNPDKPATDSISQLQDVPENWPTGRAGPSE